MVCFVTITCILDYDKIIYQNIFYHKNASCLHEQFIIGRREGYVLSASYVPAHVTGVNNSSTYRPPSTACCPTAKL